MNEIIKSLYERKSMRVYEETPIPSEMKQAILDAASQAPSAGCQQLYTILDITNQDLKNALSETCDHQPFIAKAPMVLVFCADCKKWYDAYREAGCEPRKPGVGDLMLAVTDTAIAAQNAVVAAQSFGIGSCYIGDIMENCEEQRKLLLLPDYVFPAAMLVFGWPSNQQKQRTKPERCPQKHIVHENAYRKMDGTELRAMLKHRCKTSSFEKWCRTFCDRKYNSDFSKEMTRSVNAYLEQFFNSDLKKVRMTNKELMLSEQLYFSDDEELKEARKKAKTLTRRINTSTEEETEYRQNIFRQLFGKIGDSFWIEPPFRTDYGCNTYIGDHFYANYDCIIIDVAKVSIGSHVLFGPRVSLYTAGHPIDSAVRDSGLEYGKNITIGDHVWIGGNTVINPGVKIGSHVVIGSGSVVTKDIPDHVVAAGVPCRVIRQITEQDTAFWQEQERIYSELHE